jgi:hypothetical protein
VGCLGLLLGEGWCACCFPFGSLVGLFLLVGGVDGGVPVCVVVGWPLFLAFFGVVGWSGRAWVSVSFCGWFVGLLFSLIGGLSSWSVSVSSSGSFSGAASVSTVWLVLSLSAPSLSSSPSSP